MYEIRDLASQTGLGPHERMQPSAAANKRLGSETQVTSVKRWFRDAFINGADARLWDISTTDEGTFTHTRNAVVLGTGTTVASTVTMLSKETFTAPMRLNVLLIMSQRITNQNTYIEFVSVGPNGEIDEQNTIGWLFDGSNAFRAKSRLSNAEGNFLDSATFTTTSTTTLNQYNLDLFTDQAWFNSHAPETTNLTHLAVVRTQRLPDTTAHYKLRIRTENAAVITNTNITLHHVHVEVFQEIAAEITNSFGAANRAQVSGLIARDGVPIANPIIMGAAGQIANPVAITGGRTVDLISTTIGALIVKPYSIPEADWRAALALTTTASTPAKAAGAAGIRNYVTGLQATNNTATPTLLSILDGAAVMWTGNVPANGSIICDFVAPLRGTAATALNVQAGTAVTTLHANLQGYEAP